MDTNLFLESLFLDISSHQGLHHYYTPLIIGILYCIDILGQAYSHYSTFQNSLVSFQHLFSKRIL